MAHWGAGCRNRGGLNYLASMAFLLASQDAKPAGRLIRKEKKTRKASSMHEKFKERAERLDSKTIT